VKTCHREDPAVAVHADDEIGASLIARSAVEIDDQECLAREGAAVLGEQDHMDIRPKTTLQ